LDPEGTGIIPRQQFVDIMTGSGRNQLSRELAEDYLRDPEFSKDGGFDYRTFCHSCFDLSRRLTKATLSAAADDAASAKLDVSWSRSEASSRGAFYFEGDTIIGHQFNLKVAQEGMYRVQIKVQNRK